MKKTLACYSVAALLLVACTSKESETGFIDLEVIDKNDAFRAAITNGHFVKLTDGYTYYEIENNAKDTLIVMVHGFSVPSYIWDSTYTAAVERGYGALRYDTYGRGNSENPDVAYDVSLFVRQLKELLDTLNIEVPVHLMGLSDGGRTVSAFTSQYPERVRSLIYVDAVGFSILPVKKDSLQPVSEDEIKAFKKERYPTMASGQLSDFYDSVPFRGWDIQYKKLMAHKGFVRALISTGKHRSDLEADHRKIAASNIPVSVLWGEHDTVVKLDEARPIIEERIPGAQLFVIPAAAHLPQMEQTKVFNSILFDRIIRRKE